MKSSASPSSVPWQEQAIESKRTLLTYLRSDPKKLTMESFLCLTELLRKAGWRHEDPCWCNGDLRLPTQAAAIVELERQISEDEKRLLRQTITRFNDLPPQ